MSKVENKTRAPKGGREIVCPECDGASTVYHFSWSALACVWCEAEINKNDWETNSPGAAHLLPNTITS